MRMNRAGRQAYIVGRMKEVGQRKQKKNFTRGEIAKLVGLKSTTYLRRILDEMVTRGLLSKGSTPHDKYDHEIDYYSLVVYEQMSLPDHEIIINSHRYLLSHSTNTQGDTQHAQASFL